MHQILFGLAHTATDASCRFWRKMTVGGGEAKSVAKRFVHVHAFIIFHACSDDSTLMRLCVVHCWDCLQGWFPSNYIEKMSGEERLSAKAALSSPSSSPAQSSAPALAFARVLFDYEAAIAEELTLKVDQFIEVTRDAIHVSTLSRAPTNLSCRFWRKTTVGGGEAKSVAKRCTCLDEFIIACVFFDVDTRT